jgi:hypothetical protein
MKNKPPFLSYSFTVAASLTVAALTAATTGLAVTPAKPVASATTLVVVSSPGTFERVAFTDSAEAQMLHQAYKILATGDHDYKGHRAKAMHAVEAAAKVLSVDLSGDRKDRTPQLLSDEKLREAEGLIRSVRNSAEVKDQERVTRHLDEAIAQIDVALSIH